MKGRLKKLFGGKREPAGLGSRTFEYATRAAFGYRIPKRSTQFWREIERRRRIKTGRAYNVSKEVIWKPCFRTYQDDLLCSQRDCGREKSQSAKMACGKMNASISADLKRASRACRRLLSGRWYDFAAMI
jgi:hypothetical protein